MSEYRSVASRVSELIVPEYIRASEAVRAKGHFTGSIQASNVCYQLKNPVNNSTVNLPSHVKQRLKHE